MGRRRKDAVGRDITPRIGGLIGERRDARGMTQRDLAEELDVSLNRVQGIEQGKVNFLYMKEIHRLAEIFGVDVTEDETEDEAKPRSRPVDWANDFVFVKELDVRLSAGGGSYVTHEEEARAFPFYREWWNRQINRRAEYIRLVHVDGHSMNPLLSDRDAVLVDLQDRSPKSGRIFAVILEDGSAVKEIQVTATHLEVWERYPARQKIYEVLRGDERAEGLIRGRVLYHRSGPGLFQSYDEVMHTLEQGFQRRLESEGWSKV